MQSRRFVPATATAVRIWEGWSLTRYPQKRNLGSPESPSRKFVLAEYSRINRGEGFTYSPSLGHRLTADVTFLVPMRGSRK
jgi:hypothetical protein